METLLADYYMASVICGAIGLAITIGGGWLLIKGLESLKSENNE